jgi:hypothetical protein
MRQGPIVDQLKKGGLKRVYGAQEFAGLAKAPAVLPAQFVIPLGEEAAPSRHQGVHHQEVTVTFGVVTIVNGASRSEERIAEDLAVERAKVEAALVGWQPPDASRACDYAGGRTLSVDGTTLGWLDSFRTGRTIRKVPGQ